MNLADLPPPPPDSNLTLAAEGDGVVITLPKATGSAGLSDIVVFTGMLLFVLCVPLPWFLRALFADPPPRANETSANTYGVLLVLTLLVLVPMGKRILERERGAFVFINASRFAVGTFGLFGNRDYIWPRERLRSIAAWQGLHIRSTDGRQVVLLKKRDPLEVRYVAEVARLVLQLPEQAGHDSVDLVVTFEGTFWQEPEEGLLQVAPGCLTLAHPFASKPHLKFVASDSVFCHWWFGFGATIALSPSDLLCRQDGAGNYRLEIAPANVLGGKGTLERPRIDLAPMGRIFTLSFDLDHCHTTRLPAQREPFRLVLHCADPEALPRAVARFWGNEEGCTGQG